jgi:patatin-like phospholipase/acyl hydrolase
MTFRILSLDGGGIRGAFTASLLAEIEKRFGMRVGDYFDLVAGTSTGALIAVAVSAGLPASQIAELYQKAGPEIFKPRPDYQPAKLRHRIPISVFRRSLQKRIPVRMDDVMQTKYDSARLKSALLEVFGEEKIGSLQKCRVVIPSVDVTAGKVVVFKTPHLPYLSRDRHEPIVNALLATTAAPTYFPHAVLDAGGAFLDGGLWANNPSLVAYTEAMKIQLDCTREVDPQFAPKDVQILSIGTGQQHYSLSPPGGNAGLGWWGPRVFDVMSMSQSQGVNCHLKYLIGERYRRVNFDLPDSTWTLDAVQHLDALIHKGRKVAHEHLAELKTTFFAAERPDYVPFDEFDADENTTLARAAAC